MITRGPFELWRSGTFSDGWRPHHFWWPRVKKLNRYGPPPHGLHFKWGRLHLVVWYRDRERAA